LYLALPSLVVLTLPLFLVVQHLLLLSTQIRRWKKLLMLLKFLQTRLLSFVRLIRLAERSLIQLVQLFAIWLSVEIIVMLTFTQTLQLPTMTVAELLSLFTASLLAKVMLLVLSKSKR
jgi:hypothetical protein